MNLLFGFYNTSRVRFAELLLLSPFRVRSSAFGMSVFFRGLDREPEKGGLGALICYPVQGQERERTCEGRRLESRWVNVEW